MLALIMLVSGKQGINLHLRELPSRLQLSGRRSDQIRIESTFENSNHNIHSTQDTTDHPEFSFTHMREFSKLCIAFAIELAGIASH